MVSLTASFGVRLQGLRLLRDGRRQSPALRDAAKKINGDLSTGLVKRYNIFSRGGGTWPPIAESTARRKGSRRILFHTGDLLSGLKMGLNQRIAWNGPWMVITHSLRARRVHKPSKLPIQELVRIHQMGLSRLPKRPVLVKPDAAQMGRIRSRLITAMRGRR